MDRRENALINAINHNEEEIARWTKYQTENEEAINNLEKFGEKLEVDVMVPIGSKALMPGKLIHTNEVFVSHFRGMFSKCSAFQAEKICRHRLGIAKEQLEKLNQEREMFENKLKVPHFDGALPDAQEREIIEEYDEEKEKTWREQHKQKIREHKLMEKEARDKEMKEKSHEDVMNMLEELELMDELDAELDEMQVEDDETLRKLMDGDTQSTSEKKRISYDNQERSKVNNQSDVVVGKLENAEEREEPRKPSVVEEISQKYKELAIEEKPTKSQTQDFTNNNRIPNTTDFDFFGPSDDEDGAGDDGAFSDASTDTDIPKEVLELEEECKHLNRKTKIQIYKEQIRKYEQKIDDLKVCQIADLDTKMNLIEIREYLMDYLEMIKDEIDSDSEPEPQSIKKKRSITFAADDEIRYFEKKSSVADMFKNDKEKKAAPKRDVIKLDPIYGPVGPESVDELNEKNAPSIADKRKSILEKVEKDFEFRSENQSQQDFDVLSKIITDQTEKSRTLRISFRHSNAKDEININGGNCDRGEVIGSPADIYRLFDANVEKPLEVSSPLLKGDDRSKAYEDVRAKFSDPRNSTNTEEAGPKETPVAKKSIIKNIDAVQQEPRKEVNPPKPKPKKKSPEYDDGAFDFEMIMGDIVENQITSPEPLPSDFIDAHAPKRRVSRFKQMRMQAK